MLQRALACLLLALSCGCVSRDGAGSMGMPVIQQDESATTMLVLGFGLVRINNGKSKVKEVDTALLGVSTEWSPLGNGVRFGFSKVKGVVVPVGTDYIKDTTTEVGREIVTEETEENVK